MNPPSDNANRLQEINPYAPPAAISNDAAEEYVPPNVTKLLNNFWWTSKVLGGLWFLIAWVHLALGVLAAFDLAGWAGGPVHVMDFLVCCTPAMLWMIASFATAWRHIWAIGLALVLMALEVIGVLVIAGGPFVCPLIFFFVPAVGACYGLHLAGELKKAGVRPDGTAI